jgi:hypothetical protein
MIEDREMTPLIDQEDNLYGYYIDYINGTRFYRKLVNNLGILHRDDKPAIECTDGYKAYFFNGKRHRDNGPAVEYGSYRAYYFNGYFCKDEEEFVKVLMFVKFISFIT